MYIINIYNFHGSSLPYVRLPVCTSFLGYVCAICGPAQVTFRKQYQMAHMKRRHSRNFEPINQYLVNIGFLLFLLSLYNDLVSYKWAYSLLDTHIKINIKLFQFYLNSQPSCDRCFCKLVIHILQSILYSPP